MLSSSELAAYQSEFNNLLGGTCFVTRAASSSDGMGGGSATWGTVATVSCNYAPLTAPKRSTTGDAVSEPAVRIVTLPASTDVTTKDRLVIDGQTLEVIDVREPRTFEFVRRVEARIV